MCVFPCLYSLVNLFTVLLINATLTLHLTKTLTITLVCFTFSACMNTKVIHRSFPFKSQSACTNPHTSDQKKAVLPFSETSFQRLSCHLFEHGTNLNTHLPSHRQHGTNLYTLAIYTACHRQTGTAQIHFTQSACFCTVVKNTQAADTCFDKYSRTSNSLNRRE